MGGNTGEIEIGSERGLYKYINQAGTTKASTRIILVQMYDTFFLNPKCNYSPALQEDKMELVYVLQEDPRN